MKSLRMLLLAVMSSIILMAGIVSAETGKVISEKNEFGGKTEETTYTSKEAMPFNKLIAYYDSNGKKRKEEAFDVNNSGNRNITYYDSNEKITKAERFYVNDDGLNKEVEYYDGEGKKTKAETFYTAKFAKEQGYNREILETYNDKREYYMDDRLIKTYAPDPAETESEDEADKDTTSDYKIRDGLTPQVILLLAKKAELNKNIPKSWLGELDVIYGHYTSPSGVEALVLSRNGQRSHAEVYTHVWLLGLQKGQWRLLRNVGAWDVVEAQVADVNGDRLDEVMLSCYGGNGFGYNVGMLYSFKGNRLDTLYRNEGHENWTWGFHPDYKKNILKRLYTVAFTSPDSAGMRTLVERQDLHMGRKISRRSDDDSAAPDELYEETGKTKYITTRFHLINGHYRPIPNSAVTTTKPIEMKEIPDAGVRISVPPDD